MKNNCIRFDTIRETFLYFRLCFTLADPASVINIIYVINIVDIVDNSVTLVMITSVIITIIIIPPVTIPGVILPSCLPSCLPATRMRAPAGAGGNPLLYNNGPSCSMINGEWSDSDNGINGQCRSGVKWNFGRAYNGCLFQYIEKHPI